jgi:hypothetical protein
VYTASPDDVWIAGFGSSGKTADRGFIQHWNGSSWETVVLEENHNVFYDIDGSAADDIWVVGAEAYQTDLLLHWQGDAWVREAGPGLSMANVLNMAPGNAWAIPQASNNLYYWDGSTWQQTSGAGSTPTGFSVRLSDVSKAGGCDAWMVGEYHDGTKWQAWGARLVPGDVDGGNTGGGDGGNTGTATNIFVKSIDLVRLQPSRKVYQAQATVTVLSENNAPVSNATVTVSFSGPTNETQSATTNSNGVAVITSSTSRDRADWCMNVVGITATNASYNSSLNTVVSVCEGDGGSNTDGDTGGGKKGGGKGKR